MGNVVVDIIWNPVNDPGLSQRLGFPKLWQSDNVQPFNKWLEEQGYETAMANGIADNRLFTLQTP